MSRVRRRERLIEERATSARRVSPAARPARRPQRALPRDDGGARRGARAARRTTTSVRAIVIAGSDEVFAAGADIRALRDRTFGEALFHPDVGLLEARRRLPDAADRRGLRVRARRRLRAGARLRHDRGRRRRRVRPARDHARDHPRRRRDPAPRAGARQAAHDGAGADRPALLGEGGPRVGPRQPAREGRRLAERGDRPRPRGRLRPAAGGEAREAGGAGRRRGLAERRARAGAAPVRARDGDRGPGRGHERVPREAQARTSRAGREP